jgi:phenylpropionate dioxygenase-like ring-hydroxylating dioxygenase large terminal subunit
MVGRLRAKVYPTRTLKGWVFVWMGQGEPAPIEEDVPPEFFDDEIGLFASYTYWKTNWLLALENHSDAHNAFYVHRNCVNVLLFGGGRNRTPLGPKSEVINGGLRAIYDNQDYYADENGKIPYQMYYPGVDGVWPKHRWRRLWVPIIRKISKTREHAGRKKHRGSGEWQVGHHLPSLVRTGGGNTRYAVPVKPNLSRIVHFYFPPRGNAITNLWNKFYYGLIYNPLHYNFSAADDGAASQCRFWSPEQLSSTDSQVVVMRRMIVERSRDAQRAKANGHAPKEAPPVAEPAPSGR